MRSSIVQDVYGTQIGGDASFRPGAVPEFRRLFKRKLPPKPLGRILPAREIDRSVAIGVEAPRIAPWLRP